MADKVIVSSGYQGPPGPKGDTGDAGAATIPQSEIDKVVKEVSTKVKNEVAGITFPTYVHTQSAPLDTWNIAHNLDREAVNVVVYDSTNTEVLGFECLIVDSNNVQLKFGGSFSGKAYIL